MKNALVEMKRLASAFAKAGDLPHAEHLHRLAQEMSVVGFEDEPEEESEYSKMAAILNAGLTKLKKGGWWDPPHNFVINSALMGLNTWQFGILPMFAAKTAYRPADPERGMPEGIVIDPSWHPAQDDPTGGDTVDHSVKNAEVLMKYAKGQPTVLETVKLELNWVEKKFGVKIPSDIEGTLIREAPKVAARRWGINRLRTKKVLVPFDGSKAQELSSWG